jgi:hypothetical protein
MFIGSSVENLDLAYAAQEELEFVVEPTVWSQGVFGLSRTAMASLIDELDVSDFGLFILAPDDVTAIRDRSQQTVRDNVIFELGMFIGRLGVERCFIIVPRGVEDLHLPTDLLGLTPATFDPDRQDGNLQAALGPACNRIRKSVTRQGKLTKEVAGTATSGAFEGSAPLYTDPTDCLAVIESWLGARTVEENTKAMRYDDVDRELKLAPGSARQFLEQAALRFRLDVAQKGQDVILFKRRPAPKGARPASWLSR